MGRPCLREQVSADNDRWELCHLDEDWSQAKDLAESLPDKLAQMRDTVCGLPTRRDPQRLL
ncbi:MAG: hypothetical protein ACRDUB_15565 [Mycobacterium sp.]